MLRSILVSLLTASVGTVLIMSTMHISLAQVMQSTNFKIQSDSVNMGGGFSSSTNYGIQSTVGEVGSGFFGGKVERVEVASIGEVEVRTQGIGDVITRRHLHLQATIR